MLLRNKSSLLLFLLCLNVFSIAEASRSPFGYKEIKQAIARLAASNKLGYDYDARQLDKEIIIKAIEMDKQTLKKSRIDGLTGTVQQCLESIENNNGKEISEEIRNFELEILQKKPLMDLNKEETVQILKGVTGMFYEQIMSNQP